MTFAGVNYLAIVVAAVVAWLAGTVWYMAFGKTWLAALEMTPEKMQATNAAGAYSPFILSFVAELVMAWTLAGLLFRIGPLRCKAASSPAPSAGSDSCSPRYSSTTASPSATGGSSLSMAGIGSSYSSGNLRSDHRAMRV